ncbi:MAG: RcnB family protein [Burkholderiaceae bacterium]|jgi:Ni/Co efflux regulator RcnB|nr:RcnB family protein [Burkholderiaceae bacterium]
MTIRKFAVIASAALLISGGGAVAFAQGQPQLERQAGVRSYGMAGTPAQQAHRVPSVRPGYHAGTYRPPVAAAPPYPLPQYRQPVTIITPSILVGNALPYGYSGYYPIDNWGYYNLPAPCCGQYWVQYGQSFLLVSPNGVVLQVFTP